MIKKLISKLFGIKECACPEDIEEPIILENETPVEKNGNVEHTTDIKKVVLFVEN
jgi:hypothetical protein